MLIPDYDEYYCVMYKNNFLFFFFGPLHTLYIYYDCCLFFEYLTNKKIFLVLPAHRNFNGAAARGREGVGANVLIC